MRKKGTAEKETAEKETAEKETAEKETAEKGTAWREFKNRGAPKVGKTKLVGVLIEHILWSKFLREVLTCQKKEHAKTYVTMNRDHIITILLELNIGW